MMFHSTSLTGCAESREFVTSAIFVRRGSALMVSSVIGPFNVSTARVSTMPNLPVESDGSR
jgi:hypothetical protein